MEIWLNHVLVRMKATVRHEVTEGVTACEEKPREQWLFDYPAQVSSDPSSGALLLQGLCRPPGAARLTHASGSGEAGREGVSRRDQGIVSHDAIQRYLGALRLSILLH